MMVLSRRGILSGAAGLAVMFGMPRGAAAKTVAGDAVDGFLAIGPDGGVTVYSGKVDLGTGARAALRQIVAEELGLAPERIALVEGDTDLTPDQGPTSGSTGIAVGGMQIRQAAATARAALIRLAADRSGRPATDLTTIDGEVRPIDGVGSGIGFGALIGGRNFTLAVDRQAALKNPAGYRIVGTAYPRPDLPGKLTARHMYVHDFKVAGMLHARVIRPPAIGAVPEAVDTTALAAIPGAALVRIGDFLAVTAPREWNAVRAMRALKIRWSEAATLPGSEGLYEAVRATPVAREEVVKAAGDASAALDGDVRGGRLLKATYQWPMQSHGSMGPSCAVADMRGDGGTVWTASQATHRLRGVIARLMGLKAEALHLVYLDGAGCYGTNGHDDAALEAALISRATARPVRVQWMREDEHGWDPKGPPQLLDLRAKLDADGALAAWETTAFLPANTPGMAGPALLAAAEAGLDRAGGVSAGQLSGNSDPPYAIPHVRASVKWLTRTVLRPSNLRAPGKIGNVFAVESFLDELAAAAGTDPLDFRLARLKDPRGIDVLLRVAARMGWVARPSPGVSDPAAVVLRGRGIAYVHYKQAENHVAIGLEVAVTRETGAIRVSRVVCAHDCGLMINPGAVRAQVEGSILQTISRTLFEEVTFDRSRVTSTDWASYPILTFPDVPKLEIELIDRPHERPLGAGEAATAPVAAALGNAVFDATGLRLRTAPMTQARVKAAWAAQGT